MYVAGSSQKFLKNHEMNYVIEADDIRNLRKRKYYKDKKYLFNNF